MRRTAISKVVQSLLALTLLWPPLLIIPSLLPPSYAQERHVFIEPSVGLIRATISVQPGRALQYELPLTQGMTLVAEFQVQGGLDNRVNVWLLDLTNFQRWSAGQQFSFFRGTSGRIQNVAKYRFVIPQTSVYHLVLDNRRSLVFARNVRVYAYALSPTPTAASQNIERAFGQLYSLLKQMFVFQDFRIAIRHCGLANAFSDPHVTLCIELLEHLNDQQLRQAIVFVLFHELGHSLLRLWGRAHVKKCVNGIRRRPSSCALRTPADRRHR